MALAIGQVKAGTYTGTGAAQQITLGFKPDLFMTFNQTDGDSLVFSTSAHTAATGTSVATPAAITNGVTFNDTGVSVGTDTSVNENTKTFVYFAV